MASISDLLPGANTTEPDDAIAELISRTSITEPDKTGHFEKLPREIRDQIYDLLFQERDVTVRGWYYKIRTTLPKARLISRRTTREYDERPAINNYVEACECNWAEWDCQCTRDYSDERRLSTLAPRTTIVHVSMITCQEKPDVRRKCMSMESADAEMESYFWGGISHLIGGLPL
jgi:hypothetical protein